MNAHESEVRALLDNRVAACEAKDVDRLMSLYAPDIVYFDVVPPLRFAGADEVRRNFLRWFDEIDGPLTLETQELTVTASGDVAFAHLLHRTSGTRKDGTRGTVRVRSTVCCHRSNGAWTITHEHVSTPGIRLATGGQPTDEKGVAPVATRGPASA